MDLTKRTKKPPPLPKFEQVKTEDQSNKLQSKLEQFLNEIKKDVPPPKLQKKKLALANINSKLNSMLNSKNMLQPKPQPDYDPTHPNSYQLCKHLYLSKFMELKNQNIYQQPKSQQISSEQQAQESYVQQKEQIALKMMQRCGYKVGQGLGKQSQGIRAPLIIKKTTDTACVIEQSSILLSDIIVPDKAARTALSAHHVSPTRVIVFVNLLTLSELTQEIERDLKEECKKFGTVTSWVVYLFNAQLRLFVQYSSKEEALAAWIKINNKYFGEKFTSVRFYAEDAFQLNKYQDKVHDHIAI